MMRRTKRKPFVDDKTLITYVGKAKSWCVTVWKNNIQKQHWFATKQEAEAFKRKEAQIKRSS